ncbi:hypothetical protein E2542_SST01112 [Spatholobus suberectus]|nr:hypothetical protein E2542_SST01112 [Spatholobus suberectus]
MRSEEREREKLHCWSACFPVPSLSLFLVLLQSRDWGVGIKTTVAPPLRFSSKLNFEGTEQHLMKESGGSLGEESLPETNNNNNNNKSSEEEEPN